MSNEFFQIKNHPIADYGKGVFARKTLLPGAIILKEQPLCRAGKSDASKVDAYNALDNSDSARFLTLHGTCCCTDPARCNETRITKIWHINAFAHKNGSYVYHQASNFNHACLPNAFWAIEDEATITITVIRKIEEGEEITIPYFDTIGTTEERIKCTRDLWNFTCGCSACKSGIEITNRMCEEWSKADW
ncbi:SET domain-containing protein [Mollisia scopiformis]|uniref:SET domain-containing protein n=1 Tax=Mollisia scopiformis TaxID=149040 RepID=A0A194XCK4_MOLSC|nr:SET domain-containing protein [Mollisia scopiformis]KUJ17886.1 SET domain-containing protein [Mollisia scopiformis]